MKISKKLTVGIDKKTKKIVVTCLKEHAKFMKCTYPTLLFVDGVLTYELPDKKKK